MAQKKLKRFREIGSFSNVLQYPEDISGKWEVYFRNKNPISLELACGKGEYTIGLATLFNDRNIIGIDIKGNRLWVGAKKALESNLTNAAFLRTQIDKINQYFKPSEVDQIWITFPDPHLRVSKAKKRLTHPKFLRLYHQFLRPGGTIHLKTDSPDLYQFTKTVADLYDLKILLDFKDLYQNIDIASELHIKTHYESLDIAQSNRIFYLSFTLPSVIESNDQPLHDLLKEEVSII